MKSSIENNITNTKNLQSEIDILNVEIEKTRKTLDSNNSKPNSCLSNSFKQEVKYPMMSIRISLMRRESIKMLLMA